MIRGLNQLTPQLALWNSRDVEVKFLKAAGETIVPCPSFGFGSGPFAGKGAEPVTFPLKTKVFLCTSVVSEGNLGFSRIDLPAIVSLQTPTTHS